MTSPGSALKHSIHKAYADDVGRSVDEIPTPSLVLDLQVARTNMQTMKDGLSEHPIALRPHIKVHKCAQLALLQMEYGAVGVAVATPWEAWAMASAGIDDVLIANQVVGKNKIQAVCAAARIATVTAAVDSVRGAQDLSDAATANGVEVGVLIERDIGMERGGVRTNEDGMWLAQSVSRLPGLVIRGVQGYEGHCMLEPDPVERVRLAHAAMDLLAGQVAMLEADGHDTGVVSGGGTGTWNITGTNPLVTELQAGSYVVMDLFHGNLVPQFQRALHVRSTVAARHGGTVILDAGRKSVGIDFVSPHLRGHDLDARYFAEEHALFDFPADACPFEIGDTVDVVPGYGPTTSNLYDVLHVADDDTIIDVWPIVPRGPGGGIPRLEALHPEIGQPAGLHSPPE